MSKAGPRAIAAPLLHGQQFEEQIDRLGLLFEQMLDRSTSGSDPTPATNEAGLAKQGFFDRDRIETGHVPARIPAFDIETIGLHDHDTQNRAVPNPCRMTGLNHPDGIDSFW